MQSKNYPKWDLHVQVMQLDEMDSLDFDTRSNESMARRSLPINGSRDNDVKS